MITVENTVKNSEATLKLLGIMRMMFSRPRRHHRCWFFFLFSFCFSWVQFCSVCSALASNFFAPHFPFVSLSFLPFELVGRCHFFLVFAIANSILSFGYETVIERHRDREKLMQYRSTEWESKLFTLKFTHWENWFEHFLMIFWIINSIFHWNGKTS